MARREQADAMLEVNPYGHIDGREYVNEHLEGYQGIQAFSSRPRLP